MNVEVRNPLRGYCRRIDQSWNLIVAVILGALTMTVPMRAAQDTVIVFNEVQYNPKGTEEVGEWIELHNQMGVNVDMSGWSITGGVSYTFPRGTVIEGGGYLLVSNSELPGIESGRFVGALSNGGEELVLRDNSDRPMSILQYGDSGAWPVEADGSGFTLAKLDPNSLSSEAHNWTWSVQLGGTPGSENFPDGLPERVIQFNEHGAASDADFFVELTNMGAQSVDLIGAKLHSTNSDQVYELPNLVVEPNGFVFLSKSMLPFESVSDGDRFFLLASDEQSLIAGIEVREDLRGRHPDGSGEWMFPDNKTPGGANAFNLSDAVVINEIMYHFPPQYAEPGVPDVLAPREVFAVNEEWKYNDSGEDLGTAWREQAFDDGEWPSGQGALGFELGALPDPLLTTVERRNQTTVYFRKTFQYDGNTELPVSLRLLIDDGVVVYVNGKEVAREGMPSGEIKFDTRATASPGNAEYEVVELDENPFVIGENVIAAEVHNQSPGSSDLVFGLELLDQVVEKPGVPDIPFKDNEEEWIELLNRSENEVDLSGWRIRGGIDFDFPEGITIPADGFLVVSNDASSLRAKWPDATIVGDFSGILNNDGDRIRLKDANNNLVDEVRYYDGGKWSGDADGGGSSLELMDADGDNSNPGAWAGSDESAKSEWLEVSYIGESARVSSTSPPTRWHEFIIGMLDAGEMLIDDVSVVENPFGDAEERIQNTDFSESDEHWRLLGTHGLHGRTVVVDDPDAPGNKVLKLVSTGGTDHKHDHIETTFADGARVRTNNEYKVSFRAKWLKGSPQLNSRIYFFHLARTTILPIPQNLGTPGAPNSQRVENIGPTYGTMRHSPVVPKEGEPIRVSIVADDPDGVESMTLKWLVDENDDAFKSVPMALETDHWVAEIPAQSKEDLLHVYVEGKDVKGAVSMWPRAGADSRALIRIDDERAGEGPAYNLRILMRDEDADMLHTDTNVMSNHRIKATIVFAEKDVYYNVGIRLKGSQRGRNQSSRVGFNIGFDADQKFRGLQRTITVDRSGAGNEYSQKEILVKHAASAVGGVPNMYDDLIHLVAPRRQHNGGAMLVMTRYGNEFLEGTYENGSRGHLFEYELIYYPTSTRGGTEGLKRPEPDSVTGVDIKQLGDGTNREHYRWYMLKKNNAAEDAYSEIMEFMRVMGLGARSSTRDEYERLLYDTIDVDQWLRTMAFQTLFGTGDNYLYGAQHNGMFYVRPSDGKVLYFPWDMDFTFSSTPPANLRPNNDELINLFRDPARKRLYFGHLDDVVTNVFNDEYFDPWVDHYNSYLTRKDLRTYGSRIRSISRSARRNIDREYPMEEFEITTNGGNEMTVEGTTVKLQGTGWINVRSIRVEGIETPLELSWVEEGEKWEIEVPLKAGRNEIALEALDFQGAAGSEEDPVGRDTIVVVSNATIAPANAENLVISELMYNPVGATDKEISLGYDDGDDFEFVELMNIGDVVIDLRGVRFTQGIDFEFSTTEVTELAPGDRYVLVSNAGAFSARYGEGIADGDYAGRLSNGGESVRLEGIDGVIKEFAYSDAEPWSQSADGEGYALVLQGAEGNPNHGQAESWAAGAIKNGTPGAAEDGGVTLEEWLAQMGLNSPDDDPNSDGVTAILEFAFGTDLSDLPVFSLLPQVGLSPVDGADHVTVSYRARSGATGISYGLEQSSDLNSWSDALGFSEIQRVDNGDGTENVILRSNGPIAQETDTYLRVLVSSR